MRRLFIPIINDGEDVVLIITGSTRNESGQIIVDYLYTSFDVFESYHKDISIFFPEHQEMIKKHFRLRRL